jgi:hypothetical protein
VLLSAACTERKAHALSVFWHELSLLIALTRWQEGRAHRRTASTWERRFGEHTKAKSGSCRTPAAWVVASAVCAVAS